MKTKRPKHIGPKLFKAMLTASGSTMFNGFMTTALNASDIKALVNDVTLIANDINGGGVTFHNATGPVIKFLTKTPGITYIEMSALLG